MTIKNRKDFCHMFGEKGNVSNDRLSHDLYKATSCGAWCQTVPGGVKVGTIVEGSEAEYSTCLEYPFGSEYWDGVVSDIEAWADAEWHKSNDDYECICTDVWDTLRDGKELDLNRIVERIGWVREAAEETDGLWD